MHILIGIFYIWDYLLRNNRVSVVCTVSANKDIYQSVIYQNYYLSKIMQNNIEHWQSRISLVINFTVIILQL